MIVDNRDIRKKDKNVSNQHKKYLSQTHEFLKRQKEIKGDPIKLINDLKLHNELNKLYN